MRLLWSSLRVLARLSLVVLTATAGTVAVPLRVRRSLLRVRRFPPPPSAVPSSASSASAVPSSASSASAAQSYRVLRVPATWPVIAASTPPLLLFKSSTSPAIPGASRQHHFVCRRGSSAAGGLSSAFRKDTRHRLLVLAVDFSWPPRWGTATRRSPRRCGRRHAGALRQRGLVRQRADLPRHRGDELLRRLRHPGRRERSRRVYVCAEFPDLTGCTTHLSTTGSVPIRAVQGCHRHVARPGRRHQADLPGR